MIVLYKNLKPSIGKNTFIAPNASIIGDVRINEGASIWYGTVLRGDLNFIEIGAYSNMQDLSVFHVTEELPVKIGQYVTIGHGAIIHGCTIDDSVLVGMGAVILDGVKIGRGSIIGAGAVIKEKTHIPPFSLVVGVPAVIKKTLNESTFEKLREHAMHYFNLAQDYV